MFRRSNLQLISVAKNLGGLPALKISLKAGVTGYLSYIAGVALSDFLEGSTPLINGLWCTISGLLLVVQGSLGASYLAGGQRILGTLLGAVVAITTAMALGMNSISLAVAIVVTVWVCQCFQLKGSLNISLLTAVVILLLGQLRPEVPPWQVGLFRFLDAVTGIGIGLAVAHLLWPTHASSQIEEDISSLLSSVSSLYRLLVSSLELPERGQLIQEHIKAIELKRQHISSIINDLFFEVTADSEEMVKKIRQLGIIADGVMALRQYDYSEMLPYLDAPLQEALQRLAGATILAFEVAAPHATDEGVDAAVHNLSAAVDNLNADMLRYRLTHQIRQAPMEIAEEYFSYTYALKALADKCITALS